jgi:hypothetical protein
VLQSINSEGAGADDPRILRVGWATLRRYPRRSLAALLRLLGQPKTWALVGWIAANAAADAARLPLRLLPAGAFARYRGLPRALRAHARYAERKLELLRWSYLGLSLYYQLELTRAQIPLQRFGKCVEHLVAMLAVCHHASRGDESLRAVAVLEAQLLRDKYRAIRLVCGIRSIESTRRAVAAIGTSLEADECSLLDGIEPQAFGHPWSTPER